MKTLSLVSLIAVLTFAAAQLHAERAAASAAQSADVQGRYSDSVAAWTGLKNSRPLFVENVDARRAQAASHALDAAIAESNFPLAVEMANLILDGPENGFEPQTRAKVEQLPDLHLQLAEGLLTSNKLDAARHQVELIRTLYRYKGRPDIGERADDLESRILLRQAEQQSDVRDPDKMLRTAAELDSVAGHSPDLAVRAVAMAGEAADLAASRTSGVLPMLRWLDQAKASIPKHPDLLAELYRREAAALEMKFHFPPNSIAPDALSAIPPGAAMAAPQLNPGRSVKLSVTNSTSDPITVFLRGPKESSQSLAGRETRSLTVPSGVYLQLVRTGTGVRSYLGLLALNDGNYTQIFHIESAGLSTANESTPPHPAD